MKFRPVKSVLSKWLLTAIVILGFFTFSGIIIQTTNKVVPPDTTLVAGFANRASKSLSYKAALGTANRSNLSTLISRVISLPALSFLHSLEADISIKQTSKLFIPGGPIKRFLFNKNFNPVSGDDSNPFIG
ncbi:hypothetical protein SNE26_11475 [Mucilaginibacter sp. cycad4]|uniref:hypothetical protein n=1 Tax=Mucilaginibacter sp. cycad4 TaxID=3342096 RepID=UPI002AAA92E7|nr:hypothetical protein [Mucilaginibacter gossypii]WPV02396.1 hypothetical protein SNE26_11475 [Mucilaginibacter gossypii]